MHWMHAEEITYHRERERVLISVRGGNEVFWREIYHLSFGTGRCR